MPTNVARYARLAEETAVRITGSYLSWTDFLNTAARLYNPDLCSAPGSHRLCQL